MLREVFRGCRRAKSLRRLGVMAVRRLDGLVAEHSIFNSRARLGFADFTEEERREMPPVPQVVIRSAQAIRSGDPLGLPQALDQRGAQEKRAGELRVLGR